MLLLLRMVSGASPANPYQVYVQATPVLKIEPDNSPEVPWVSYAVSLFHSNLYSEPNCLWLSAFGQRGIGHN